MSWHRTGIAAEMKFIIEVRGSEVCLKLAPHLHVLCLALSQCFKSQTSTNAPAHQMYSSERYLTSLKFYFFHLVSPDMEAKQLSTIAVFQSSFI